MNDVNIMLYLMFKLYLIWWMGEYIFFVLLVEKIWSFDVCIGWCGLIILFLIIYYIFIILNFYKLVNCCLIIECWFLVWFLWLVSNINNFVVVENLLVIMLFNLLMKMFIVWCCLIGCCLLIDRW